MCWGVIVIEQKEIVDTLRADSDAAADDIDKNYLNGIHVRFSSHKTAFIYWLVGTLI